MIFVGKFLLYAIKTGKVVTELLNSNFLFFGNYPKMCWEKILTDQPSVTVFPQCNHRSIKLFEGKFSIRKTLCIRSLI